MNGLYKNLPQVPGVYLMKDKGNNLLYVGKAANLRRRVSSYFMRAHDIRIERLVSRITKIDHIKTDSALEALILEAKLIKKYQPPFNVREKDDKSFLYAEITEEKFPRILLVRGKDSIGGEKFGPFTSAANLKQALRILRKIFPWNVHPPEKIGGMRRPCFDYEIGLCPGTCVGAVSRTDYLKTIRNLKLFFEGNKKQIIPRLEKEMKMLSKNLEFEKAEKIRRQIFALQHIRDTALLGESEFKILDVKPSTYAKRIEGYDISNISGTSAVGSMVVFEDEKPNKEQYRKFKIKTVVGQNDVGMLKEVLGRRFKHGPQTGGWPLPDLILVDGGAGQVSAAKKVLNKYGLKIPAMGIAKGQKRKRNDLIGIIPKWTDKKTLIAVRDEAHRFALRYHKELRERGFIER